MNEPDTPYTLNIKHEVQMLYTLTQVEYYIKGKIVSVTSLSKRHFQHMIAMPFHTHPQTQVMYLSGPLTSKKCKLYCILFLVFKMLNDHHYQQCEELWLRNKPHRIRIESWFAIGGETIMRHP